MAENPGEWCFDGGGTGFIFFAKIGFNNSLLKLSQNHRLALFAGQLLVHERQFRPDFLNWRLGRPGMTSSGEDRA